MDGWKLDPFLLGRGSRPIFRCKLAVRFRDGNIISPSSMAENKCVPGVGYNPTVPIGVITYNLIYNDPRGR